MPVKVHYGAKTWHLVGERSRGGVHIITLCGIPLSLNKRAVESDVASTNCRDCLLLIHAASGRGEIV